MKYTWRMIFPAMLLLVNIIIDSQLELAVSRTILIYSTNMLIGGVIGYYFDKFSFSKKEFRSTQTTLINYARALEYVSVGIGISNKNGQYEFLNTAHLEIYGYDSEDISKISWQDFYSKEVIEQIMKEAVPELEKHGRWQSEIMGLRKDGSSFPQEVLLSNLEDTQKIICVVRDISEQKQYLNYIEHVAEHNELTKLPNRRKLLKDINKSKEALIDVSLLFLDLDRFKIVNDTFGHHYGDELLIYVAKRLLLIKNKDLNVYHLGGDEFIILIQTSDYDYIKRMAKEIINQVKQPYFIFGKEVLITTSIGICQYPKHTNNYDELINFADTAMYYAKLDGKNTYKFFNEDLGLQLERKGLIENELRKAIANKEFVMYYQPKCDLIDSKLVGFEALLRWKNPLLGMVSPAEFIPIAEDIGLITDIGKWIIEEVLRQMNQWQSKGYPLVKVSVNVSQRQFKNKQLVNYIERCLDLYKIDAKFFEIEITESLMADFELTIPQLTAVKERGVGISIDDFGTGYSSLSFITNLPVDTLKIDQSFIRGLLSNENNRLLVKTIIDIGNTLELDIVAEGIETEEQLEELIALNCRYGQGYLFSKPLSALEVESRYWYREPSVLK